jgi:hypothetical protein
MGSKKHPQQSTPPKKKTPTFLLELPLAVQAGEAARLPGHLEAGRQFYNAVLSEGQQRLRQMRADPAQAGPPAPSPGPTRRSGGPPFRPCGSSTASPSTPFTISQKRCGSRGWPSTWMQCWPRKRGKGAPRWKQSRGYQATRRRKEGQVMPRSMGIPRAGARLPESRSEPTPEPACSLRRGRVEAWKERENPRGLGLGSIQYFTSNV